RCALHPFRHGHPRDLAEGRCEVDLAHRVGDHRGGHPGRPGRTPHHRQSCQCVDVVGALEQESEVSLELTVVTGQDDVCVVPPTAFLEFGQDPSECLVEHLVLDVHQGVDLTDLVVCQIGGD